MWNRRKENHNENNLMFFILGKESKTIVKLYFDWGYIL
jgi:hypothetical protein